MAFQIGDMVEVLKPGRWQGMLAEVITVPSSTHRAELYVVKLAGDGPRPARLYAVDELALVDVKAVQDVD